MNKRIIAASVLMALAMFVLSGLAAWVTFGAEACERVAGTCVADIPRQELVIIAEDPGASVNDVQSAVAAVRRAQPMHVSTVAVDALAIPELNTTVLWTRGGSASLPATLSNMRGVDVARPALWEVSPLYSPGAGVKNRAQNFTHADGDPIAPPPRDAYWSRQWGPRAVHVIDAWPVTRGASAVVGIIDTGIDCRHQDLAPNCTDSVQHYDALRRRWIDKTAVIDPLGHGSHVAGIVAAPANDRGVVGVAPSASLISFRACSSGGSCADLDIAAAIVAAWGRAHVLNLSLGGPQSAYTRLVCDALHTARDEYGMLAIASAGNSGRSQAMYPASCPGVVGVGSTDPPDGERVSSYSQRASVDLVAPGRSILSVCPGDGYCEMSGTSMAAPHVTGVAALLYAASRERGNGDPRPVDVEKAMEATARRICGNDYREDLCGHGLVQAGDAVRWIAPDQATATATDLPVEPTDPPDPWLVSPTPTLTPTLTARPTPDCALDPVACAVATAQTATAAAATPKATGTPPATRAPSATSQPSAASATATAAPTWTPRPSPVATCVGAVECARATVTARSAATATERAIRTAVAGTIAVPTDTPVPPIETLVARLETAEACKADLPALPDPCRVITLYYPIALAGPRATETPTGDAYPGPVETPTPCAPGVPPHQCAAQATRTAEAGRTPLPTRCPNLVCNPKLHRED